MSNYCFCYSLDVGVTLIGFLHLNAALYFWARASIFEPIYMWIDIVIAACYTVRATYFFLMMNQECSTKSRQDYFEYNKWTAYGLGGCGFAICSLKWLEWGHPPTWSLVAWTLVGLFNYYHWTILEEYAGATTLSKVELAEKAAASDGEEDEEDENDADEDEDAKLEGGDDPLVEFLVVNKIH